MKAVVSVGRLVPRVVPEKPADSRELTVSVWLGFAPCVADVVVTGDVVAIKHARLEPKANPGRIGLTDRDLDRVAIVTGSGAVSLRDAIKARAKEEAYA
ncbi:hypothetical protein LH464_04205 [Neorhizobium sp. T786]|uniref:hypothetical protein n=1 Tax=Pseudorhizobium xiangyangii TaxID=2883104 RepID=UPI001CFF8BC4|nr:hypothetical protein [Neorhizobium xiangyangii]MCB5201680.1 hypothetical protein [Neorhizobium xiangyangii]